ncbi:MAG: IS607 family transposase [Desulfobacterium sp.]
MKAKQVLNLMQISRPTLTRYVKNGLIKTTTLLNGRYDYDENSVYAFLNKNIERNTVVYARVSTSKQKSDLVNQVELLKNYCFQNGWQINNVYQDIASGISFDKRKDFFLLLDDILAHKVKKVIISYKDRLSRVGFELFSHLFKQFGTDIIVISDVGSEKLDSQEVFEEIVSLLHCYSMKLYSKRKKKLIQEIINEQS